MIAETVCEWVSDTAYAWAANIHNSGHELNIGDDLDKLIKFDGCLNEEEARILNDKMTDLLHFIRKHSTEE